MFCVPGPNFPGNAQQPNQLLISSDASGVSNNPTVSPTVAGPAWPGNYHQPS
jgi:hypothetical protein